jgi:hypothetical protein
LNGTTAVARAATTAKSAGVDWLQLAPTCSPIGRRAASYVRSLATIRSTVTASVSSIDTHQRVPMPLTQMTRSSSMRDTFFSSFVAVAGVVQAARLSLGSAPSRRSLRADRR